MTQYKRLLEWLSPYLLFSKAIHVHTALVLRENASRITHHASQVNVNIGATDKYQIHCICDPFSVCGWCG